MRFLGAVYAAFITAGAGLGAHTNTGTMSTRYQEILTDPPARATSHITASRFVSNPLEVNIIFTDLEATAAALKIAQSLAGELGARIRLRAAVAVPFQLPIDRPQVSLDFLQEMLGKLVSHVDRERFQPTIHLYVCRHRVRTLLQILKPDSLVIIGGRNHWWPTAERRIARAISSKGHRVVFVDSRPRANWRPRFLAHPIFARGAR